MRSLLLFGTIALGVVFPQGHRYTFLIRYLLMAILFLSLIDLNLQPKTALNPKIGVIVGLMMAIAAVAFWIGGWFSPDLAIVALVLAMAPTAAAAPVVTRLVHGQVETVVASVLVTNSFSAIALPLVLPRLFPSSPTLSTTAVLASTLTVVLLPLAAAQLVRQTLPPLAARLRPLRPLSFYLWMVGLYLATAGAAHFIRVESQVPLYTLVPIGLMTVGLCAVNFGLGRWVGAPQMSQEMGQSLGQKNTLFAIWVCLTFLTPAIALGPMLYIICQNVYNAFLLAQHRD